MKTCILGAIISIAIAFSIIGCKSQTVQVIYNGNVVTNSVPMKAFNDNNYVWESWTTGTNTVDSIDK